MVIACNNFITLPMYPFCAILQSLHSISVLFRHSLKKLYKCFVQAFSEKALRHHQPTHSLHIVQSWHSFIPYPIQGFCQIVSVVQTSTFNVHISKCTPHNDIILISISNYVCMDFLSMAKGFQVSIQKENTGKGELVRLNVDLLQLKNIKAS